MVIRILCVIQLSIAFCLILWHGTAPFLSDLFRYRSELFLLQTVMGKQELLFYVDEAEKIDAKAKLERNSTRYRDLSPLKQREIEQKYTILKQKMSLPWEAKLKNSAQILLFDLSPLLRAWILFAILISILILLGVPGANWASWIPFAIAVLIIWDRWGQISIPERSLYPTEQFIYEEVLKEPISSSYLEQKKQLERGWNLYLLQYWSDNGLEEAEFAFNLALIGRPCCKTPSNNAPILFFVIWNCLYAMLTLLGSKKREFPKKTSTSPLTTAILLT